MNAADKVLVEIARLQRVKGLTYVNVRTLEDRTDYPTRHLGKILATLEDDEFLEVWSSSSPKTYRITSHV